MLAILTGRLYECVVCADYVPPSGLGELALGLIVTTVKLAPAVILHRFLRSRGR